MSVGLVIRLSISLLACIGVTAVEAASVKENNLAMSPPVFPGNATTCTAEFQLKPAGANDGHGYVVVSGPDGRKLELRGGPSRGGGSGSAPGLSDGSSGDQPSGNPFGCTTSHPWGVVVPYVGKHGNLGTDSAGNAVYSPDGNVANPLYRSNIGKGAQSNVCAMANCMMTVIKALGSSCKIYTLGTGALRNSNTLISLALSSCGVPDPLPSVLPATGWGNGWD